MAKGQSNSASQAVMYPVPETGMIVGASIIGVAGIVAGLGGLTMALIRRKKLHRNPPKEEEDEDEDDEEEEEQIK